MCFFLCNWRFDQKSASRDGLLIVRNSKSNATIRVPIYKRVSRRTCPLLDYTWERQWTRVVDRCISHPAEASCISDFTGRTALHLASLNHGSPDFVARALIRANPHALLKQDMDGQTPLHSGSQFAGGTNKLVVLYCATLADLASKTDADKHVIVHACPSVTASPLYLGCSRNAPFDVVRALVDTQTSIGPSWIAPITGGEAYFEWQNEETTTMNVGIEEHEDATTTPLSVLVDSCPDVRVEPTTVDEITVLSQDMKNAAESILANEAIQEDAILSDSLDNDPIMACWLKCILLLKPYYHSYSHDNNGASLLHLVAALRVPVPALVAWCARVLPQATAFQRDTHGYIPLHYALVNPTSMKRAQDDVIKVLLRSQPDAAKVGFQGNGQSSLVMALQKQPWPWSGYLQELVMANPDALMQRGVDNGFYPYQLAASLNADLSTIYGLLRLRPDLLPL